MTGCGEKRPRNAQAAAIVVVIGFLFVILLPGAGRTAAQTAATGVLGGTVTDVTGAVVPGAEVHVTSRTSGEIRTPPGVGQGC